MYHKIKDCIKLDLKNELQVKKQFLNRDEYIEALEKG